MTDTSTSSYLIYAQLSEDFDWGRRCSACIYQQANGFLNDGRPQIVALSTALLKHETGPTVAMRNGLTAGPGFDTDVDNGDGTIDSSKITDGEMLSQCQAIFPQVASLYFNDDGTPIPPSTT